MKMPFKMPFSRDYSRFVFDPFKDLWFMEKAQYEIDTYGTERDNILKLSSLRNIREKCIQEFQRDVTHKYLRNRWDYLKNKTNRHCTSKLNMKPKVIFQKILSLPSLGSEIKEKRDSKSISSCTRPTLALRLVKWLHSTDHAHVLSYNGFLAEDSAHCGEAVRTTSGLLAYNFLSNSSNICDIEAL
ncbi:hypothetical protein GIB67_018640 [Kingdonia uniflora]|uniref:Uncharacterized protein n=1 Tax=Kingdonia uniflora TaxID=39325 RepID=A0A7J7M2J3_9MAGN|nr:hypothetical protein GIB67_018640 [Kingdonia uniflora]